VNRRRELTILPLSRTDVLRMVKRRARAEGLPVTVSCHSLRASGIAAYLQNGGTLETAQALAAHKSARSTRRYSPAVGVIPPDEIDRIRL
jgi:integrase